MTSHLKLKAPEPLPAAGVTATAFKVFVNKLTAYLLQDTNNYLFITSDEEDPGVYSNWSPLSDGKRIKELHVGDPETATIDALPTEIAKNRKRTQLLLQRNSQLQKCIQMIADFIHYTEADDVVQRCPSVPWIWSYLRQHYNIESQGVHFLKISEIVPSQDEPHQAYYRRLRASFKDNLMKKGAKVKFLNVEELDKDEAMTPCLEQAIVLWALREIDKRLPEKVDRDFGHLMTNGVTLADIQVEIFQKIPVMLKELNETELRSLTLEESNLNSFTSQSFGGARGNRGASRGRFNNRGTYSRGGFRGGRTAETRQNTAKFCKLCHVAGKPLWVSRSHSIAQCNGLTERDRKEFTASLGYIEGEDETASIEQQAEPLGPIHVPGWDTDVAATDFIDNPINEYDYVPSFSILGSITPIPTPTMKVAFNKSFLDLTLDLGANVSYVRLKEVLEHNYPVLPNNQLALLGDGKTKEKSLGEIDVNASYGDLKLKLRALVMKNLHVPCFAGTTFHKDNGVIVNLVNETITLHFQRPTQKVINIAPLFQNKDIESLQRSIAVQTETKDAIVEDTMEKPEETKPSTASTFRRPTVHIKEPAYLLPNHGYNIQLPDSTTTDKIAVIPRFREMNEDHWKPQVCDVVNGQATYLNGLATPVTHPKNVHFQTVPVKEYSLEKAAQLTTKSPKIHPNGETDLIPRLSSENT